jgi:hypothetical protein
MDLEKGAWRNVRNLKQIRIVALVVFCAVFVAGPLWEAQRVSQRKELKALYLSAHGGDLDSVRRLAEHHSAEATGWLGQVAQDQNASANARAAAIAALGKKTWLDSEGLARLLWIEQPFAVRRAAADVFRQRGCDDVCLSAALYALNAMWSGAPSAENRLAAEYPASRSQSEPVIARLRGASENDYVDLLNKNPCAARKTLTTIYSSQSTFVGYVESKLGRC